MAGQKREFSPLCLCDDQDKDKDEPPPNDFCGVVGSVTHWIRAQTINVTSLLTFDAYHLCIPKNESNTTVLHYPWAAPLETQIERQSITAAHFEVDLDSSSFGVQLAAQRLLQVGRSDNHFHGVHFLHSLLQYQRWQNDGMFGNNYHEM